MSKLESLYMAIGYFDDAIGICQRILSILAGFAGHVHFHQAAVLAALLNADMGHIEKHASAVIYPGSLVSFYSNVHTAFPCINSQPIGIRNDTVSAVGLISSNTSFCDCFRRGATQNCVSFFSRDQRSVHRYAVPACINHSLSVSPSTAHVQLTPDSILRGFTPATVVCERSTAMRAMCVPRSCFFKTYVESIEWELTQIRQQFSMYRLLHGVS